MNTATATYTLLNPTRAVVDMSYVFSNGKNHTGFSTVDVDLPSKLYDACYDRAEALAKEQGCRLEKFSKADFRVYLTNFQYFIDQMCDTLEQAKALAKDKGFDATIYKNGEVVGSWSAIGGFRLAM